MRRFRRLALLVAAVMLAAACRPRETQEEQKPVKGEMPVEQTPVSSLYEEKQGVLYERAARTATVSPVPARTPSPRIP